MNKLILLGIYLSLTNLWCQDKSTLLDCSRNASVLEIKEVSNFVLNYIDLPPDKKKEFLAKNAHSKEIFFENYTLPILDVYAIGLSKRPYFKSLCKEKSYEIVKNKIIQDLNQLSNLVINSQKELVKSPSCSCKTQIIKRKPYPSIPLAKSEEFSKVAEWENLNSTDDNFFMVVHMLRLRSMEKDWIRIKFLSNEVDPLDIKGSRTLKKISASLISNYSPYVVRGSFMGFSLEPSLKALIVSAVTDINSSALRSFDEITQAAAERNLDNFKKFYPTTAQPKLENWALLNPFVIAALSRDKGNELVFKSATRIKSYVMYDLSDPNNKEALLASLDSTEWNKLDANFSLAMRELHDGCKKYSLPLIFIKVAN